MRRLSVLASISSAAVLALLTSCSGGSAIPSDSSNLQRHSAMASQGSSVLNPVEMLKLSQPPINRGHPASFDNCPAKSQLVYVSDAHANEVDIFAGKNFTTGETPCGIITGLNEPQGLTVSHHELYVANTAFSAIGSIERFRRGSTSPDMTYVDSSCGGEDPVDVAVAPDGTVIATDIVQKGCSGGALSTWNMNGTFVGNFQVYNGQYPYFVTVKKNGTVYYDDSTNSIQKGSCPAGVCGVFRSTGTTFSYPGGLRSASGLKSEDIVLDDQGAHNAIWSPFGLTGGGSFLTTYESFPIPKVRCPLAGTVAVSFDFNYSDRDAFYADAGSVVATDVKWTDNTNSCTFVASVAMRGQPIGVAVDIPGPN